MYDELNNLNKSHYLYQMSNYVIETDQGYVKLSDKNDVELYMLKENDKAKFRLTFQLTNPNYDLNKAIGFKLFALMAELNKDIIASVVLSPYNETTTEIDMGLLFCRFGADFGLAQKYIYSHSSLSKEGNKTIIRSQQQEKPDDFVVPPRTEPATGSSSMLELELITSHKCKIVYDFVLDLEDDLPIYMEKMPGRLMHKVFSRLKVFIESLV